VVNLYNVTSSTFILNSKKRISDQPDDNERIEVSI